MRATRDDHGGSRDSNGRHSNQTLIIAIGILILAGGAYLLMPKDDQQVEAPQSAAPQRSTPELPGTPAAPRQAPAIDPVTVIAEAPDVPEQPADPEEPVVEMADDEPAPPPPPSPEEIDRQFREAVAEAGISASGALGNAISAPYLLDRGISSADQVARGLVPRRTLNLPRPKGQFPVQREGMNYSLDPQGYARYNSMVAAITALPTQAIAGLFHEYRAQLESAYAALGYPADAMDNTLIAALDQVLAAPVLDTAPELTSKGAVWAYADAELEGASDVHKQLLRAGPDNTKALQSWAAQLRRALLNP